MLRKSFLMTSAVAGLMLAGAASVSRADVITLEASNNATVKPAGPRSGTSGKNFFNVEGNGNAANASYGVADFTFSGATAVAITSVDLQLTQSNAAFSVPGAFHVYLSSDTSTSIEPTNTGLIYNSGLNGTDSVGSQLGTLALLGTGSFNTTGNVNNGTVDTSSLTFSGAALTTLLGAINGNGTIRLVITPDTDATAATYAGYSNSTYAGPTLVITTAAVPEPATLGLLAIGGSLLLFRRRQSA